MPGQTYGRAVEVSAAWLDRGATAGVRGLNKELGGTGTAAQAAERGVDSFGRRIVSADTLVRDFTRSLATFATGYISVRGVMELGSIATEMYQTRTQVGALSQALEFQLAPAGKTVAQAMREARAQTAGVISDLTLMVQMRSAMEALTGAGFNPVEAYDIFQTSSRFAVLQGKVFGKGDPNQILERLMTGFSRGAFQWLDDYNLRVQGLTGTFDIVNEAMRQMNKGLEEQGRLIEQSVTGLDRLKTSAANFKAGTSDLGAAQSEFGGVDPVLRGILEDMIQRQGRKQLYAGLSEQDRRMRKESGYKSGLSDTATKSESDSAAKEEREWQKFMAELRTSLALGRVMARSEQEAGYAAFRERQTEEDARLLGIDLRTYQAQQHAAYRRRAGAMPGKLSWDTARLGPMWEEPPDMALPTYDTRPTGWRRFIGSGWGDRPWEYMDETGMHKGRSPGIASSFGYGFNQWMPQGGMSQMFGQQLGQQAFGTLVGGPMMALTTAIAAPFQGAVDKFWTAVGLYDDSAERMREAALHLQRAIGQLSGRAAASSFLGDEEGALKWQGLAAVEAYEGGGGSSGLSIMLRQYLLAGQLGPAIEYLRSQVLPTLTGGNVGDVDYSEGLAQLINAFMGLEDAVNENTDALRERLEQDVADAALRAEYAPRFLGATSDEELYQTVQEYLESRGYQAAGQSGSYGGGGSSGAGTGYVGIENGVHVTGIPEPPPGVNIFGAPAKPSRVEIVVEVRQDGSTLAKQIKQIEQSGDIRFTIGTDGKKVNVTAL